MDIQSYVTFSTLIKVLPLKSACTLLTLLSRLVGLCTQTFRLGVSITFVYTFYLSYHCK
jgi:hypothetical protein